MPLIEKALDLGVNYADTSARYGGVENRWSEQYFGEVMKTRRSEVYLATKTHDRTRDGSMKLLERSLELLKTDHIDLWQMHNLARMDQVDEVFAPGGAIEALIEAREQGIVRNLGISGHADPDVLIAAIKRFDFDTVLMALNAADRHYSEFQKRALALGGRKGDGDHRYEDPGQGPHSLVVESPRRSEVAIRQHGARHPQHAGGDAVCAVAAGEHGHRRVRHHPTARRERRDRPFLQPAQRDPDGGVGATHRTGSQTGALLPPELTAMFRIPHFALIFLFGMSAVAVAAGDEPAMDAATVDRFAELALGCIHQEYPNKISHVLQSDDDVAPPRELTPAFYGCFDWHSSVHGHWMLVRLSKTYPDAEFASAARTGLAASLTKEKLAADAVYLAGTGTGLVRTSVWPGLAVVPRRGTAALG